MPTTLVTQPLYSARGPSALRVLEKQSDTPLYILEGDTLNLVLMASRGYTIIWLTAPANPPAMNLWGPDIKFGSLLIALFEMSKMNILKAVSGMIFKQLTPFPRKRLLVPSCGRQHHVNECQVKKHSDRDVKMKENEQFVRQAYITF
jgi:hypothetical protein